MLKVDISIISAVKQKEKKIKGSYLDKNTGR